MHERVLNDITLYNRLIGRALKILQKYFTQVLWNITFIIALKVSLRITKLFGECLIR